MNGVTIKQLKKIEDHRGFLYEIYRCDDDNHINQMAYMSYTKEGISRGPHEHNEQIDFFVFIGPGDFEFHVWNKSGEHEILTVGESNPVSIRVKPCIIHGYKAISHGGAWSVNLPDSLYGGWMREKNVDEIRHEGSDIYKL
jgi:dTDP-4-dehydrorhamnose 3,5-epimerase